MSNHPQLLLSYLSDIDKKYVLIKAEKSSDILLGIITTLINFKSEELISVCFTPNEISLIVSTSTYKKYFDGNYYVSNEYYAIAIDSASGDIDTPGILAKVTQIFAEYKISILCISTYCNNFILFESSDLEKYRSMISNCMFVTAI
jgi:hypothetical protein